MWKRGSWIRAELPWMTVCGMGACYQPPAVCSGRSNASGSTHERVHDHVEAVRQPKSRKTDAAEMARGENIQEGQRKEQQDACQP